MIIAILLFCSEVVFSQIEMPLVQAHTVKAVDSLDRDWSPHQVPAVAQFTFYADSIFNLGNFKQRGYTMYYTPNLVNGYSFNSPFLNLGTGKNYAWNAAHFDKEFSLNYTLTNEIGNQETSLLYATGVSESGWAFAGALTGRFGHAWNYADATNQTGVDYFVSIDKVINNRNSLNLLLLGGDNSTNNASPSVDEAFSLAGSNWGWYQGVKRSSQTEVVSNPTLMLSYEHDNKKRLQLDGNIHVGVDERYVTQLNWLDAPIPYPDYYQYLPSFYGDSTLSNLYSDAWLNNAGYRQIDWDELYATNQLAEAQGKSAQYILEQRWKSTLHFGGAVTADAKLTEKVTLKGGIDLKGRQDHYYKVMEDLLGASYWIDQERYMIENNPANENLIQFNDLSDINKEVTVGDIFGYDYVISTYSEQLWATANFKLSALNMYVGGKLGASQVQRKGNLQNGRDENNSLGNSETKNFFEYGILGGFSSQFAKNHYANFDAKYLSGAPESEHIFLAKNISNSFLPNISNQNIIDGQLAYTYHSSVLTLKVNGFATYYNNLTQSLFVFHDDLQNYVNYGLTGMNQFHVGAEWLCNVKVHPIAEIFVAGSYGDYRYTSNPLLHTTTENGVSVSGQSATEGQSVQWDGLKVGGMPQVVSTVGTQFNVKGWRLRVNGNFFTHTYAIMNPERRTESALAGIDETTQSEILKQEKYDGVFTVDISIAKNWQLNDHILGFSLAIKNLTHNTAFVQWAQEPYRYNTANFNTSSFQNKTLYAYGATFWATLHFTL